MFPSLERSLARIELISLDKGRYKKGLDPRDSGALKILTSEICKDRHEENCYSCKQMGECSYLNAVLFLGQSDFPKAIHHLEKALQYFSTTANYWNAIITQQLLGLAYEQNRDRQQAVQEYNRAQYVLSNIYLLLHRYDAHAETSLVKAELDTSIVNPMPLETPPASTKLPPSYLKIPWIPVYSGVRASPTGPIWSGTLPGGDPIHISKLSLNDATYTLHTLNPLDRAINLTRSGEYGWIKVVGDSMSACQPQSILENDLVLFLKSAQAESGKIVIAACPEDSGAGLIYVVKRFSGADGLLLSETNSQNKYPPIALDETTQIIGIVIAIARPEEI